MVNFGLYTSKALYSESNAGRVAGQDQNQMQHPVELTACLIEVLALFIIKRHGRRNEIVSGWRGEGMTEEIFPAAKYSKVAKAVSKKCVCVCVGVGWWWGGGAPTALKEKY